MPSKVAEGAQRGWIVPIGGAEDKQNDMRVLRKFFELCGGKGADIAVIPTASKLNDTGERYEQLFGGMGARNVHVLDFDTRRDARERNRACPPSSAAPRSRRRSAPATRTASRSAAPAPAPASSAST